MMASEITRFRGRYREQSASKYVAETDVAFDTALPSLEVRPDQNGKFVAWCYARIPNIPNAYSEGLGISSSQHGAKTGAALALISEY